jgi:hypothetical protein
MSVLPVYADGLDMEIKGAEGISRTTMTVRTKFNTVANYNCENEEVVASL